jgi:hypothetical protein
MVYGRSGERVHHRGPTTRVRTGSVTVAGSLDRDVVRRVLRRHRNEIRFCYERELVAHPELGGRLTLALVVGPDGAATSSRVSGSTLGDATVSGCVAQAGRRWTFPAPPGGGVVTVSVPYVFTNG